MVEIKAVESLIVEKKELAWHITLNRPEALNALTDEMLQQLKKTLSVAQQEKGIRAIVITGNGKGFCVGADLAQFKQESEKSDSSSFKKVLEEKFHPIVRLMRLIPQIVIAKINGVCAGAGLALALSCDIKLALKESSFVAAFAKVGLAPDTGSSFLFSKSLGYSKALDFFLLKGKLQAEDLERGGLINKICETRELLDQELAATLRQLSELPSQAVTLTKRALRFASEARYCEEALAYEATIQDFLGKTDDHKEGMAAFLEKRKPVFKES